MVHHQRKKKPEKVHNSFNATHADTWSMWSFHLSSSAFPGISGFFPPSPYGSVPFRSAQLNVASQTTTTTREHIINERKLSYLLMLLTYSTYRVCVVEVFPPPPLRKNQKEMWKKKTCTPSSHVFFIRGKWKKGEGFLVTQMRRENLEGRGKKPLESSHDTQFSFRLRLFIHHRLKGSLI